MKNSSVMTRRHPRWDFFYRKLWQEGCQFRWTRTRGKILWDCNEDFTHARGILRFMGLDVEASGSYFRRNGARCDCEVVFVLRAGGKYTPERKRSTAVIYEPGLPESALAARALPSLRVDKFRVAVDFIDQITTHRPLC